jgi:hypothetical protein
MWLILCRNVESKITDVHVVINPIQFLKFPLHCLKLQWVWKKNHRTCDFQRFKFLPLHIINSDTTIHSIYRRKQNRTIHILCKNWKTIREENICCCKLWICKPGFIYGSCIMVLHLTSSCSLGTLEQCVSKTVGRMRWTKNMACFNTWCKLLTSLPLRISKVTVYATDVNDVQDL